jgi:hypothetical protein
MVEPTPITVPKLLAFWCERTLGRRLKSSSLKSITSGIITHAFLLGSPTSPEVAALISTERRRFCETFPCEVRSAAPILGVADGLDVAIAYAEARADSSLFFREMSALLQVSKELYNRPTALLGGRLRRNHISYLPPSASARGGVVVSLLLPKKVKDRVDHRINSHPIPSGPAVLSLLSLMDSLQLLARGASPEAVIFPRIDPVTNAVAAPTLSVAQANAYLRSQVFVPAGLANGAHLTLRSIRSGSSTDALIGGASEPEVLAQGGWRSAGGAATYLDYCFARLSSPAPGPAAPATGSA